MGETELSSLDSQSSAASFFKAAHECETQKQDFVVITLIAGRGHIPQDPGAKAIVTRAGLVFGTVGGGKVEAKALLHAQTLLSGTNTVPLTVVWNLQRDIGMTCGGEVTYLFETHRAHSWRVRIFGAGHVAQALVRALSQLPVSVTCIDPRTEWMERLPQAQANLEIIQTESPAKWIEDNIHDAAEFFVVMTQGHSTDVPILEALFKKFDQPRYIGVIGSETKGIRIKSELDQRGVSKDSLRELRVPIGLPIGTNHPAEIAISIVAELLQVRDTEKPK